MAVKYLTSTAGVCCRRNPAPVSASIALCRRHRKLIVVAGKSAPPDSDKYSSHQFLSRLVISREPIRLFSSTVRFSRLQPSKAASDRRSVSRYGSATPYGGLL